MSYPESGHPRHSLDYLIGAVDETTGIVTERA
jgi:hypothetical protein